MAVNIAANAKQYDWQTWLIGAMRSFVAGAAGAATGILGPMATDSGDFNFSSAAGLHHTLTSMLIGFGIGGLMHMFIFLQTHSAPELVTVTETTVSSTSTTTTEPKPPVTP